MTAGELLLLFGVMLLLVSALMWVRAWAGQRRQEAGLPPGKLLYADDGVWHPQDAPLVSNMLQLVGKPDYLVQQPDGQIIPVEIKSRNAPRAPYPSHRMQLAAYCLLVTENYGIRPNHGIIQYHDRAFTIPYTQQLEEQLLDVLTNMREDMIRMDVQRDHAEANRCAACALRDACTQRLA
jgi:CRISPR-associated exonuclease Cas4